MINEGDQIDTGFTLDIVENGKERTIRFDELLDRPTVVSVYMRNNTSGCDKQNKDLAAHANWFDEHGYNLIAISKDTCGSHKNYAEKLGINYILASDPEYKFAEATDSVVEKNMFGNTFDAPTRSAYIIDTDGTVNAIIEKVNTNDHTAQLKDVIKNL